MLVPKLQREIKLIKIESPWVIECLEEKFDDALLMLTDKCIIYGGAVRDILAELPIGGDLDVAIPYHQYDKIGRRFANSVRWVKDTKLSSPNGTYPTSSSNTISSTSSYININGDIVHLIQAMKGVNEDSVYDSGVLDIILNVDLICSAVMMTTLGDVYEIIKGAQYDCTQKVLNFNHNLNKKDIVLKCINKRILKLTKRGWVSKVDLAKFNDEVKEIKLNKSKFSWIGSSSEWTGTKFKLTT